LCFDALLGEACGAEEVYPLIRRIKGQEYDICSQTMTADAMEKKRASFARK
jgi:hypothetical protein